MDNSSIVYVRASHISQHALQHRNRRKTYQIMADKELFKTFCCHKVTVNRLRIPKSFAYLYVINFTTIAQKFILSLLVYILDGLRGTVGWSDGGEISIDCYSELQNLYVSTLPSLTAGLD